MRKGFTLLELIIVIIIIGILATLGFAQYARMVEKARGAEAKNNLDALATLAVSLYQDGITPTNANLGITGAAGGLPTACNVAVPSTNYYFSYNLSAWASPTATIRATRCTGANGKQPGGSAANTVTMTVNCRDGDKTIAVNPVGTY